MVPILIENWSFKFPFFKLKMVPRSPFFRWLGAGSPVRYIMAIKSPLRPFFIPYTMKIYYRGILGGHDAERYQPFGWQKSVLISSKQTFIFTLMGSIFDAFKKFARVYVTGLETFIFAHPLMKTLIYL